MVYKIRGEFPATPAQISFVRDLIAERYSPDSKVIDLPLVLRGETVIDAAGVIAQGFSLRLELIPPDLREIVQFASATLEAAAFRFLHLLRWRQGAVAADKLVQFSSIFWRTDPGFYYITPRPLSQPSVFRAAGHGFQWSDDRDSELRELWDRDIDEPLAHELIREAQSILEHSPRSALLVAASAAEAGVKRHLSKVVPSLAWFMEEVPSPPIYKMLRDFIPIVHEGSASDLSFWEALKPTLKAVSKIFEVRNKIAHTGHMPEKAFVQDAINTIRDLLYVIDVLGGETWAKRLVDTSLSHTLNWPESSTRALLLEMTNPDDEEIRRLLKTWAHAQDR